MTSGSAGTPRRGVTWVLVAVLVAGCSPAVGTSSPGSTAQQPQRPSKADELLVVDCLLPGQIRRLGQQVTTMTARRPIKTSARDCEIRGGEYVAWDRATYESSLAVWTPLAVAGDPAAQTYVGEIYEKGLGVPPDYVKAADWYRRAAHAGSARAAVNLGHLHEHGLGVSRNLQEAAQWYRRATGATGASLVVDAAASATGDRTAPAPATPLAPNDAAPRIELSEPELPAPGRGRMPEVRVQPPIDRITVAGRIAGGRSIRTFTVNDVEHRVDADRRFHVQLALHGRDEHVKVVAVDQSGQRSGVEFVVKSLAVHRPARTADGVATLGLARYHALVIGNDDYRLLPPLSTAVRGAREIASILEGTYEFTVTLLTNASRYDILAALNDLRQRLAERDSLLIFYAGRGEVERDGHAAWWLPVDAEPSSPPTWISSQAFTDFLSAMEVRQILVTADSCYAGTFGRGSLVAASSDDEQGRHALIQRLAQRRSRVLMASGVCEPAPGQGGGLSPFTRSVADILRDNRDALSGQELFRLVRLRLAAVEQARATDTLQYAPIRHAGHEGGDFVFVRALRN